MNTANFNFQRFCLVFKRDWFENWRKDLRTYVGMFLGFFISMFILNPGNALFRELQHGDKEGLSMAFLVPVALVTILYVFLGLSGMFSNLSHKQSRISFFMLPASNLEKYLVRLLRSSVIFWGVIFICFVLADLAVWMAHTVLNGDPSLLLPRLPAVFSAVHDGFFSLTGPEALSNLTGVHYFTMGVHQLSTIMAWMGTYILGAAVFRKQPFILTSLCVFAVTSILGWGMVAIGTVIFERFFGGEWDSFFLYLFENSGVYYYSTLIFNLLWTTFCFRITYRMFKNANVIAQRTIGL